MDEEESTRLRENVKGLIDECEDVELLYLLESLLTTEKEGAC